MQCLVACLQYLMGLPQHGLARQHRRLAQVQRRITLLLRLGVHTRFLELHLPIQECRLERILKRRVPHLQRVVARRGGHQGSLEARAPLRHRHARLASGG